MTMLLLLHNLLLFGDWLCCWLAGRSTDNTFSNNSWIIACRSFADNWRNILYSLFINHRQIHLPLQMHRRLEANLHCHSNLRQQKHSDDDHHFTHIILLQSTYQLYHLTALRVRQLNISSKMAQKWVSLLHVVQVDDLEDSVLRVDLGSVLIYVQEELLPQFLFEGGQLEPQFTDLGLVAGVHQTHRTADLLFLYPFQPREVVLGRAHHFLQFLRTLPGLMRVQIPKIPVFMFEEEMRVPRSAAQDAKEVLRVHHLRQGLKVILLRLFEAESGHDQNDYIIPIRRNLAQEERVVVTNSNTVGGVEVLQRAFDEKASLTRREPFILFLMRVDGVRDIGESLNTEGHIAVVPEERRYGGYFCILFLEEEVGDGHLCDSEHAAPSGVGLIVGGWVLFLEMTAVGEADKLLIVLHFFGGEEVEEGGEHTLIIYFRVSLYYSDGMHSQQE